MVLKRPYASDDSHIITSKHIRRGEGTDHLFTDVCSPALCDPHHNLHISGEDERGFIKFSDEDKSIYDLFNEDFGRTKKKGESSPSGCIHHLSWLNSSNFVESDIEPEPSLSLALFPEYFASKDQLSVLLYSNEICLSFEDCSPLKQVPIGPEHQAEIPEWGQSTDSDFIANEESRKDLIGTCVTPMPEFEETVNKFLEVGIISCKCIDQGSIRCVRLHVAEAREKLRKSLGQKMFEELGFYDMGEEVARKWNGKEQQAFHDVVVSNPLSLGKSFWDDLLEVLPSRTREDLVSYYFNVFMLRKRAEQNRFEPLNIDSDDDEWESAEFTKTEEDGDSVVDSPADQAAPASYKANHVEEYLADVEDEVEMDPCKDFSSVVHGSATDEEDEGDVDEISELQFGNSSGSSDSYDQFKPLSTFQISGDEEDYDLQDDSCTSYECLRSPNM